MEIYQPKQTGIFMFQFDDDEPIPIANIVDYGEVTISLKQHKLPKLAPDPNNPYLICAEEQENNFVFCAGNKRFKLFIKDVSDEES